MFLLTQRTHRMLLRHDPDIGHIFVPNLRARIPGEVGGYMVHTNGMGFRSNFEFLEKRGIRPRILMFGDSYTAGDDVCNENRYSDRLGESLNAEGSTYGISGSGTDQHLLTYQKFASSVQADLVVICVQIDSFHRIQVAYRPGVDRVSGRPVLIPTPYYEIIDGELQLRHVPVPIERPEAVQGHFLAAGKKEIEWYRRALQVYQRLPLLRRALHSPLLQDYGSEVVREFDRLLGN